MGGEGYINGGERYINGEGYINGGRGKSMTGGVHQ